jgi:hypothetical protein
VRNAAVAVRVTAGLPAGAGNHLAKSEKEDGGEGAALFLLLLCREGLALSTDHGYQVDDGKRCTAVTKKQKQCEMHALAGLQKCALHSGLARPNHDASQGNPQALEAFKRSLARDDQSPRARIAGRPGAR